VIAADCHSGDEVRLALRIFLNAEPPFKDSMILTVPTSSPRSGIDGQNRRGVRRGRTKGVAS
jgi:hypothetical protein